MRLDTPVPCIAVLIGHKWDLLLFLLTEVYARNLENHVFCVTFCLMCHPSSRIGCWQVFQLALSTGYLVRPLHETNKTRPLYGYSKKIWLEEAQYRHDHWEVFKDPNYVASVNLSLARIQARFKRFSSIISVLSLVLVFIVSCRD